MDNNLSANTLFHFTPNRDNLLSILKNGLYVRYSLETFENLISEKKEVALPMVSFCDIPISQVKKHSSIYGVYAIGLTKSWGMKNKINPVIYVYPNSTTSDILNEIIQKLENFFDIKYEKTNEIESQSEKNDINSSLFHNDNFKKQLLKIGDLQMKLAYFIKYIKPYEGKLFRNGNYIDNVRFYDEKEWRYVPSKDILRKFDLKDSYISEFYKDPIKRRAINMKISNRIQLKFNSDDIRFIIVKKDNEIPDMLDDIYKIFGNIISHNQLKILSTRLISLEQIIENI